MTNDTDSFIQEVDENLRQDKAQQLLRRHGPWLLVVFIAVIVGVAGWQGLRAYSVNQARSAAEAFAPAQDLARAGNLEEAKTAFERLSSEGPGAYRAMAQMERAAVLEAEGDLEAALAAFDGAARAASDPLLRTSAQLRAAYIVADTQDFTALQGRLQPIIDGGGQAGMLAQELLAIEAWEAGDTDLARSTLENLNLAFDAPESVRQRAQVALAVLGPADATDETPGEGAPAPASPTLGDTP